MLDKIIQFSVKNKLIIGLLTLGLIIWGGYSLSRLPIDAVPDITNNQVQVITSSPSLAAEEVERLITFPIEITMATIPELEEIRSFSRFGLSVVTIVFKEDVDVYWARQQVSERLTDVQAQIPPGVGQPGMAPITTGLGEIYQYVVGTEKGYEDQYDARELRTIQDWIVRRQLLGTPGVADVSSFGGYLKQYEIAIDPDRLKAMNVSIADIFQALEENNENTGGAYIEKNLSAYFIRSEGLVSDMDDIRNMLIKNNPDGIPVLIKDVAEVKLGNSVRYGATTRDGEGEVVSAIVMMLKGENSAEVIENVKSRIAEIQKTLPEGVTIEPFLDRTKLVNTAIGTVSKNLAEGALIVIFVLLLLLGNLRAGLIVASVIPLALLFAFGMMNFFGVSGNLMSLGAIDFGLIVDGAVIIVEATLHHLGLLKLGRKLTQNEMDEEVYQSASKIRNSAAFGEIIILIVYLPILALVGIEGKMFGPMAQTVSFAILGAFILSLTYVPMMSALVLSKNTDYKPNISDKLMAFFHRLYDPAIRWSMHKRPLILILTAGLFLASFWVFSNMGGEFIPTLEEGDFAVETRVMTGSSLENTIQATTQAEKILLEQFPEVKQVVSKIGAGEIPTDPMPVEAADMMVILENKDEWVSASNREELANKMAEALEVIPGVTFGFQQPIQMRFNELMTGVRQDVAVKIYGEDLNELSEYAEQIGRLASGVEGAQDLYIEEVTGVPQIVINYKRDQLAKYGLSIRDVNRSVQAAFAGASAGLVYENERRFDLVVRLDKTNREDVESVQNLYIARKDGHQIPLYQVAEVEIQEGPYQIQRDDTRRRIIVAFNVRNRDVESIVTELQQKIEETVVFAPGYTVSYGGQFENLVEARERLSLAVPLALLLIFVLLYFTFGSIKQGILIFTAIPLSAIGGIFALWLRDMPFSISAGVGFIALFGVAVLNGIVLIGEFNHLKKEGVSDIFERIYKGTSVRLRPVIMTAAVASMGFLPMALSQSGGAEVQRPLATVVIGGLITATFLTLVVLPILYYYFERGIKMKPGAIVPLLAIGLLCVQMPKAKAQDSLVSYQSLDEAIQVAIQNNPTLKAADLQTQQERELKGTSWNMAKTNFSLTHGQYNSIYNNDNQFNISQSMEFPTVYANQKKLAKARIEASEWMHSATQNELVQQVKVSWYLLWLEKSKQQLLQEQDEIYERFVQVASLRYQTGETNLLEKATAESQVAELKAMLQQNQSDIEIHRTQLQTLLNLDSIGDIAMGYLEARESNVLLDTQGIANNPTLAWFRQQMEVAEKEKSVEKAKFLPDLSAGYFNQSLNGPNQDLDGNPVTFTSSDRFTGFQVGMAIPIFGAKSQASAIKAAELKKQESEARLQAVTNQLQGRLNSLIQQYQKFQTSLEYYEQNALPQAELILKQAQKGFESGEIGYVEYIQGLNRALAVRFNYLDILNQYNQTVIQIEFISGVQ
ncbi:MULTISPECIES: CusA/CzcA family heavy metal efflux RND transporter [Algoriphagus]|jgi:cobalt-zinc-cadmium resistance protein CzcA|uniref:Cobalt-zinc-cadmium resistance protein CzcA n=1 Tax=Algoriphagus boritolerans DSM 17298 = JCM 18970 TaxID=1120964 RepID=A0A1H5UCJ3_9BACT|nr:MULTISPECIES: CusA/CzcA family heavy metal efflux RND transporter [Algoriphagus]MDP2041129.1 CusA/CzcA family heavy metal efflux RND transporter [Algoriphagus sp.]MDP3200866.1 CusA/CzcA family heavy metal efflux RND transporter [Algoriphagus sp.]MDP3471719.1 CusA/CzcA family heavy metal efflux RND transporter [Algoriphagus sp.]SEF72835.1 cobalt-zinc-cadmium resistance protein CzcA [Algoriphagus boritolerans DSM 17298 = JCM 18970]